MQSIIKNITLGLAMSFTIGMSANNPGVDDLDKLKETIPGVEATIKSIEKINAKDVKDVFLKIKRVDRLLTPKRKLYKVKYRIA